MAYSNSYNYTDTFTALNVMTAAARKLGILDQDESLGTSDQTSILAVLNLIFKEWSAEGADIWLRDTMNLILTHTDRSFYTTATDYLLFGASVTQLSAAASAGATTVTVDSATNIATTYLIFIKLADNTIHATTVNGAPSGTTVTLTAALPSAANDNAYVYVTAAVNRFTGVAASIISAASWEPTAETIASTTMLEGRTTPIEIIGSTEFHSLSLKGNPGRPLKIYHTKKPTYSEFRVWPSGDASTIDCIELVVLQPVMDLDTTSDNLYIPPELFNALVWQLAAEISSEYGLTETEQRKLWQIAEAKKQNAFDNNVDDASFIITLDRPG